MIFLYLCNVHVSGCTVLIRFKNTGNAGLLQRDTAKIDRTKQLATVVHYLRQQLNRPQQPLVSCSNGERV